MTSEDRDRDREQAPAPEAEDAEQVKTALKSALGEVDSESDAEAAITQLEAEAAGETAEAALGKAAPKHRAAAAVAEVERATPPAPGPRGAGHLLVEATRAVETTHGPAQEALAEATQAVLGTVEPDPPPEPATERRRELLRRALLRRLKPLEALDAELFIRVNHLPHTHLSNGFFHFLTMAYHGGAAWYVLAGAAMLAQRRWDPQIWRNTVIPLTAASAIVEGPIKSYFRRRRPFIDLVHAIVIGRKPGTWSFPSGHSATAFAGAYLLGRHVPRLAPYFYAVAALVAFSRIYLGVHYPSDVLTGAAAGHGLAQVLGWVYARLRPLLRQRRGAA